MTSALTLDFRALHMLHAMAARGNRFRFCICAGKALCRPAGAIDTFGIMFGFRMLLLLCLVMCLLVVLIRSINRHGSWNSEEDEVLYTVVPLLCIRGKDGCRTEDRISFPQERWKYGSFGILSMFIQLVGHHPGNTWRQRRNLSQ